MATCYVCGDSLHEKTRPEHVIKKSFGGSIASRKLVCDKHNEEFNRDIDKEISDELDWMHDSLVQDKKSKKRIILHDIHTGEEVPFGVGLRPLFPLKYYDNEKLIRTEYYDSKEDAKKKAEKYSQQRKRQTKDNKEEWKFSEIEQPGISNYHFYKGGIAGFGSIFFHKTFLKSAINFYLYHGGDKKFIERAINVLLDKIKDTKITRFFFSQYLKVEVGNKEICHFMYLKGCPEQKILYCYIELFSTHKLLVFLSSNYEGVEIEKQYCRDIINKKDIVKNFKMHLSRNHFEDYYKGIGGSYQSEHQYCFTRLLKIAEEINKER
jgi:hypothetical protein